MATAAIILLSTILLLTLLWFAYHAGFKIGYMAGRVFEYEQKMDQEDRNNERTQDKRIEASGNGALQS